MIMCVLLCYPVSIRTYYQQGVLFLVFEYFTKIAKHKNACISKTVLDRAISTKTLTHKVTAE